MNKWARPFDWHPASAAPAGRIFAPTGHQYFAYLSYSHKDSEAADWLHQAVEKFRVPGSLAGRLTTMGVIPRRLTPVFRDRHELAAASDLGDEIRAALGASHFLIVLCSPAAARSKWTNAEIDAFKKARGDGCVVAAILDGEPFASDLPGREDEECFPPALRVKYTKSGRPTSKRAEPLAADLRAGHDGRKLGLLKIVAGMLGVGLDALVQREHTRRQKRMAWLAAASLAGMLVTTGLAVAAIQARDAARYQRQQAEGLVEFMVGDLRQKLEPIGKLDVLDGVGSKVLEYYSNQDTSELSDDALVQRSRALNLMAEVAYQRGNLPEAQELYRQAMAGTAEAVRRSPDDPKRLFDHAQNVFWVGEMARYSGHPDQAEAAYREYQRIANQMAALDPDSVKYRMEVLYANEDVGISLYDEHRFAEAATDFESVVGPMQKLSSLYPANMTYQKEVATALAWLADTQRSEGHLAAAISLREGQISTLEQLLAKGTDSDAQARLITGHVGLSILLAENGRTDRAIDELHTAISEAESLIPVERKNAEWKSYAALARLELARTLLSLSRTGDAAQQATAGCGFAAELPAANANSLASRLRRTCLTMRARVALANGNTVQAEALARLALTSAKNLHSEDPIADRYGVASAERLVGDILERSGDSKGAVAAWSAGLAQLPAGVAERPVDMSEREQLLRRLGRTAEAAPIAVRLSGIGYHRLS